MLVVLVLTVGCTASDERGAPAVDATVSTGPTGDDAGSGAGPDDAAGRPGGPADAPDGHGEPGGAGDEATQTAAADAATEAAILEAVDGYWDSFLIANDPPDPDHPALARYRTGAALRTTVENVRSRAELGQAVRLPPRSAFAHDAKVTSTVTDQAEVTACIVDDSLLIDLRSGLVLNDRVITAQMRLRLVSDGMRWRVVETTTLQTWEGPTTCAG